MFILFSQVWGFTQTLKPHGTVLTMIHSYSHPGLSHWRYGLVPSHLFLNLKSNSDIFKDIEGHIVNLTLTSPISLCKPPQPSSLKEVDE